MEPCNPIKHKAPAGYEFCRPLPVEDKNCCSTQYECNVSTTTPAPTYIIESVTEENDTEFYTTNNAIGPTPITKCNIDNHQAPEIWSGSGKDKIIVSTRMEAESQKLTTEPTEIRTDKDTSLLEFIIEISEETSTMESIGIEDDVGTINSDSEEEKELSPRLVASSSNTNIIGKTKNVGSTETKVCSSHINTNKKETSEATDLSEA